MSVTICIPCYNQQDKLLRALNSIFSQTYYEVLHHTEIIVVDDGSTEPIIVTDERVKVIRVTNRGLPNARNVALMNAKGHAFLPLDADDWLQPEYLEKTWPLLTTDVDVVLTGLQEHGPTRNGVYQPGYDRPYDQVTAELMQNSHNRFFYCSLFKTQTLREVGGYNGRMVYGFEDWDLWIDLLKRGAKFAGVNDALFNYDTSNPNSMLSSSMRMRDEIVAEMNRHHS